MEVGAIGEDARVAVHPFDLDTEVKDLGGGRLVAEMSERWWVERGPNGGYVAAVILRAIQAAAASARAPRSLTVQFPRAPLAGPVEITVRTEREGHTVTFLSARMEQDGELQATALAVLADDLEASGFEERSDASRRAAGGAVLAGPRQGLRHAADVPELQRANGPGRGGLLRRRPLQRRLDPGARAAAARRAAGRSDPRRLVPGALHQARRPGAGADDRLHGALPCPLPSPAPPPRTLPGHFRSGLARGGFVEEDGELWSQDGKLLAQSRQLALLLAPPGNGSE